MKINKTKNLDLQDDEYYVVEFTYNFEEDEADIDYRREGYDSPDLDIIVNESSVSEEEFEMQEYFFYTRDKNRLKTIEKEMTDYLYKEMEKYVASVEEKTTPIKKYLSKNAPAYREKKLERICNEK